MYVCLFSLRVCVRVCVEGMRTPVLACVCHYVLTRHVNTQKHTHARTHIRMHCIYRNILKE